MARLTAIPGIAELMHQTRGDPRVRVAVLDGPVDLGHPCFELTITHNYSRSLLPARKPAASKVRS